MVDMSVAVLCHDVSARPLARSVTTSVRRRQICNMLKTRAGAVTSRLRREIATHLAKPPLSRPNMRFTGAQMLHRCQF